MMKRCVIKAYPPYFIQRFKNNRERKATRRASSALHTYTQHVLNSALACQVAGSKKPRLLFTYVKRSELRLNRL